MSSLKEKLEVLEYVLSIREKKEECVKNNDYVLASSLKNMENTIRGSIIDTFPNEKLITIDKRFDYTKIKLLRRKIMIKILLDE